jgi:hypothetical protein
LLALGLTNGTLDVAMNSQAAAIQQRYGTPIMSRIHALYSVGGLVGAAMGGRIAASGIAAAPHLAAVGAGIAIVACIAALGMLPGGADAAPARHAVGRPTTALIVLGSVAFCVLFGEGAMANWSAVYLRGVLGVGAGLAAAGFASFSLLMAIGRFAGDTLTTRLGPARLARAGGALAAGGMLLALLIPHPWAAIVGFGAVGAGLSSVFPIVLSAASRVPDVAPGAAIAVVSMFGYTGLLAGPPIIGAVASALTLRGGLAIVAVTSVVVAMLARVLRPVSSARAEAPPLMQVIKNAA